VARTAITGTASFLGGRLLRRLVSARGADAVLAVDITPPPTTLQGVRHRMVDLTLPGADRRLVEVFREEDVDTVVHAAFFTTPRRDSAYAHELESIGTLHLAAGAAAAGVRHLLLRSFTAVYGARGQNPSFLTEERKPDADSRLAWVRDKVEAEAHAFSFSRRYPALGVTVLRFATLVGAGVHTFYTRLLSKRVVPVPLGYDPLIQMLHPDDALDATVLALEKGPCGVINVVPRATITLLTALHLSDKVIVPVPHPAAYPLAELFWASGVGEAPGGFIDYARFPCVADGEKAKLELGFVARHSSREALESYLAYRFPEAA
jgi:UDP-glucose 4-epimerase